MTDVDTCLSQETPHETVSPRKKLKSSPVVSQKPKTVDSLNELIHDKKPPYKPPDSKPGSSRDFKQQPLSNLFVLEVFAGSARLTKTAKDVGLKALAFDHSSKRSCGVEICQFDLTDPAQIETLATFIASSADSIVLIWFAPPCGTASRAREKPIPGFDKLGVSVPKPLRSVSQPDQIDGLSHVEKTKVEVANQLYEAVYLLASVACDHNVCTVVENPGNSHFWNTSPISKLSSERAHQEVLFHNCAHGGDRDKLTKLWVNNDWLNSLALLCDRSHQHAGWKPKLLNGQPRYATAEEAAYPWLLCRRIVDLVILHALKCNATQAQDISHDPDPSDSLGRVVLGALPRGLKAKPLVAEYGHSICAVIPAQHEKHLQPFLHTLPKGSKVLTRRLVKRGEIRVAKDVVQFLGNTDQVGDEMKVEQCWIGIPSDPDTFLQRALAAGHPRSLDVHVNELSAKVIKDNLLGSPYELAKKRVDFFKHWSGLAGTIQCEEEELRRSMPDHVRKIVGNKRLALFQRMLNDVGYPDKDLVKDIAAGLPLSGYMPVSGVFPRKTRRPTVSKMTLKKLAKAFNQASYQALQRRQDEELEEQAWEETQAELDKGWVFIDNSEGLFNSDRVNVGRRFGLKQGEKIRVIDDCSCNGYNSTVGLPEKMKLQTIDQIASFLSYGLKLLGPSNGLKLLGRTYDLKSAYKQFALRTEDRDALRMGIAVPKSRNVAVIGFNSLPFGAVGSVSGFLRISMAVWFVGCSALSLLWTVFYDDYSIVARSELKDNAAWAVEMLFDLIGLDFAREGKKAVPFSPKFKMLGLTLDLSCFGTEGSFAVSHTSERRSELADALGNVLEKNEIDSKQAERLRGRMIFFEGFAYGRTANAALKSFGKACTGPRTTAVLDSELKQAILFLQDRVRVAKPLKIDSNLHDTWFIFTDGALEDEGRRGTIGAVLVDPSGRCAEFFGLDVGSDVLADFLTYSRHPIHELEILPVVVSSILWGSRYRGANIVHFIDNESARMAFIKGRGETPWAKTLVQSFVLKEEALEHKTWFARVPTHSNLADAPSRLDFCELLERGALQTAFCWREVAHHLGLGNGVTAGGDE